MGAFSTLLDALIPNRYIRRFFDVFGRFSLNHIEFVSFSTLLGASVPNHIEFVTFSSLLDALIPNRYIRRFFDALGASVLNHSEFVAYSTLMGASVLNHIDSALFRRFWALWFRIIYSNIWELIVLIITRMVFGLATFSKIRRNIYFLSCKIFRDAFLKYFFDIFNDIFGYFFEIFYILKKIFFDILKLFFDIFLKYIF